MHVTDFI